MIGEKLKQFVIEGKRKKNSVQERKKVQQDNLALFRRKHGVAHEEESDKELKNQLIFLIFNTFFQVSH